jgi:hypothetical protein
MEGIVLVVLFKNAQWAVTDYGMETIEDGYTPLYHIEESRLTEVSSRRNGAFYNWPVHMAKKTWVDIEAFIEAFSKALELQIGRHSREVDQGILKASIVEARRVAGKGR